MRGPQMVGHRYAVQPGDTRQGGLSSVQPAVDMQDAQLRRVALKIIRRQEADGDAAHRLFFDRETAALRRLDHQNIVRILDSGFDEESDSYFIALEWVDRTLIDFLSQPEQLTWSEFSEQVVLPLADALATAHNHGVVHRDVKPANVLVTVDGVPKLADFGISKIKTKIDPDQGTLAAYMSRPFAPPDHDSSQSYSRDVYAFAVTVLACISPVPVRDYPDIPKALEAANLPEPVRALLSECLAVDPVERPANAAVLYQRLLEIERVRRAADTPVVRVHLELTMKARKGLVGDSDWDNPEAIHRTLKDELSQAVHASYRHDHDLQVADRTTIFLGCRTVRMDCKIESGHLVVVAAHPRDDEQLEQLRSRSWEVPPHFRWTTTSASSPALRAGFEALLAGLECHMDALADAQRRRDEDKVFVDWRALLDAKEELERGRTRPLNYETFKLSQKRATFKLGSPLEEDVIGQEWRVEDVGTDKAVARGVVVAQDVSGLTLSLQRVPRRGIPSKGRLALDTGLADMALRRQRDALNAVRFGGAVREDLRELLVDPRVARAPEPARPHDWFRDSLDEDKRRAVSSALGARDLFLLQGPPGTGKTSFITELIQQELRRNPEMKILLVSQTHVALDNALERLASADVPGLVRLGRADDPRIASHVHELLLDTQMLSWSRDVQNAMERYRAEKAKSLGVAPEDLLSVVTLAQVRERLLELERITSRLSEISASGTDDETASERAELQLRRDDLIDRVELLWTEAGRQQAGRLTLPDDPSVQDVAALIEAILPASRAGRLLDILRLQTEWLTRIESGRDLEGAFLKSRSVVAGTCLGFMSHPHVRDIEFDLCILDEASKATATETVVPLARAHRWVLVGDTRQLPPMQEEVLQHPALVEKYGLDRQQVEASLFERLIAEAEHVKQQLQTQRRMVPAIGDLISQCFYDGELASDRPEELGELRRLFTPVTWFDTSGMPARAEDAHGDDTPSISNACEAKVVVKQVEILDHYLASTYGTRRHHVLVIAPYRRQVEELERRLASVSLAVCDVEVNTVDAVQGREADFTFFSVTRSNALGKLGFLGPAFRRRINVALSRSRHGLFIVGDGNFCAQSSGPLADVLAHIRQHPATCDLLAVGADV